MKLPPARSWPALLVLVVSLLASVHSALVALDESRGTWRRSWRLRHLSLEDAQDRLFGPEFMASIRQVRRTVAEHEVLYFIDAQSREQGACYFVLHYLAPRTLVRLGGPEFHADRSLRRRLRSDSVWVLTVGDPNTAVLLESGREFRKRAPSAD